VKGKILHNFFYLSSSFVAINIFGYVFHAVISRKLGPSLYAEFNVLNALMVALSTPVSILVSAITRVAVSARTAGRDFNEVKRFSIKLGLTVALLLGFGTLFLSPLIKLFVKAENLYIFLPIALTFFIWGLNGILRGLLTSVESFALLSYAATLELFMRAVCGILFVLAGFEVFGAIAGSAFGALCLMVLLLFKSNHIENTYNERKYNGASRDSFSKTTAKVFFIAMPTGFFLQLDLLLAKRFFPAEEAGIFAAATLIGKSILLFSTIASTVVYPKLIEEKLSKKGLTAFLWGIIVTMLLFLAGYALLKFFDRPVIDLLFGDKYTGVLEMAPLYIIAILPLALHLQVTNYKGAIGGWTEGVWLWFVLIGYYVILELFSFNFSGYLKAIFIYHAVLTPMSFLMLYMRHRD